MNDPNKPKSLSVRHFQPTTWRGPMPVAGFIWLLLSLSLLGQSTVQFSTTSMMVGENAGQAVATVRRANDLDRIVTVDYATSDATATAGEDYVATVGTLTFAAGQTNQTIVVPILNDGRVEGSEACADHPEQSRRGRTARFPDRRQHSDYRQRHRTVLRLRC
jgi:hypothetical protein